VPEAHEVIDLIVESDALLSAGHVKPEEARLLFRAGREQGVRRMIISHPNFVIDADPSTCLELVELGAYVEHEVGMYDPLGFRKWDPAQLLDWIRKVGPDHTVLSANSTAKLGTVVIDGLGWTLYRFDADSAKPSRSACTGSCAEEWPPVLMQAGTPAYEGVDPSVVGTVARDDGRQQVTIGGWPVYRHASDSQPGAVDGQGAQGQWFAVTPSGGKASPQS